MIKNTEISGFRVENVSLLHVYRTNHITDRKIFFSLYFFCKYLYLQINKIERSVRDFQTVFSQSAYTYLHDLLLLFFIPKFSIDEFSRLAFTWEKRLPFAPTTYLPRHMSFILYRKDNVRFARSAPCHTLDQRPSPCSNLQLKNV